MTTGHRWNFIKRSYLQLGEFIKGLRHHDVSSPGHSDNQLLKTHRSMWIVRVTMFEMDVLILVRKERM